MKLTLKSETASRITFTYDKPPGQVEGYLYYAGGIRVSRTFNPNDLEVTFGKVPSGEYAVEAIGFTRIERAEWPQQPAPSQYGGLLPTRLAESPGPEIQVSSLAQLRAAADSVAAGTRIRIIAPIDGQGTQLPFNCKGTATAPILFTGAPVRNFTQWYVGNAAYVCFRGLDMSAMQVALKLTGASHHVEVDGCRIHDCSRQGILISSLTAASPHIQVWNNRIERCGSQANLDHGIYWAQARPGDVLANNLLIDNWAYQIQLYPDCVGLIATCNTMEGGARHPDERGGLVIGSEGTVTTRDCTIVGLVGVDAPANGVVRINQPIGPNRCFDSVGVANAGVDFEPDPNMQYVNCVSDAPAKELIQPARYGYVPPRDIDGKPRVTADAGCFAL